VCRRPDDTRLVLSDVNAAFARRRRLVLPDRSQRHGNGELVRPRRLRRPVGARRGPSGRLLLGHVHEGIPTPARSFKGRAGAAVASLGIFDDEWHGVWHRVALHREVSVRYHRLSTVEDVLGMCGPVLAHTRLSDVAWPFGFGWQHSPMVQL
jgi:hypothetical protein